MKENRHGCLSRPIKQLLSTFHVLKVCQLSKGFSTKLVTLRSALPSVLTLVQGHAVQFIPGQSQLLAARFTASPQGSPSSRSRRTRSRPSSALTPSSAAPSPRTTRDKLPFGGFWA